MATAASPFYPAGHALTADEFQYAIGYRVLTTGDSTFTTTSFSDVTGCSLPNVPIGYYGIRLTLFYDAPTAGDLIVQLGGAGVVGAASRFVGPHADGSVTTTTGVPFWGHEDFLNTSFIDIGGAGAGTGMGANLLGTLQTVVAGEVKLQARQVTASGITTVRLFTMLELMPIR
jgi:hypothetical protein